jgi:hypothetical protein
MKSARRLQPRAGFAVVERAVAYTFWVTSSRPYSNLLRQEIGEIPYRLALAGGWIDQPFISRHNPTPPGSMVVVNIVPSFRFMDRSGLATGTRAVATRIWKGKLPRRPREELVRELYAAENKGKANPSGSQDMIGLIYPGISRLDYDFSANGGVFPSKISSLRDARTARWLEGVLHVLPVAPRPKGYDPLETKRLTAKWIQRLGQSGKDCFKAMRRRDVVALGASMNECMRCWEALLPATVRHRTLSLDLPALLRTYQARYEGAMYSGCGGGYLYVVSEKEVPGAFKIKVRRK